MKKITVVLLVLVAAFALSTVAFAEPEVPNPEAPTVANADTDNISPSDMPRLADGAAGRGSEESPDKYWAVNGYPDDVSFAFEAGGEKLNNGDYVSWWIIGVVGAGDTRKQEILDTFSSLHIITFQNCSYSYSQREAAYNEIWASKDENIRNVVMGRNTESVFVEVTEEREKEYAAKYSEQYGSFVVITNDLTTTGEDTAVAGGDLDQGMSKGSDYGIWLWTALAVLLIGAMSLVYFNRARLIPALQTANGNIVTAPAPVSRKNTIERVKNDTATPADTGFAAILRRINQKKD